MTERYQTLDVNAYLIQMAAIGNIDCLHTALQAGADVHANKDEALRLAALNGHTKIVQTLLQAGADVHACNGEALRSAAINGDEEMLQILLRAGADPQGERNDALHQAARKGHSKIVGILLVAGCDINSEGGAALILASYYERKDCVELLLRAGANTSPIPFHVLKKFLTPKLLLSLPRAVADEIETSHCEVRDRYSQKMNFLKWSRGENTFEAKIALADLYYRPGGRGYYQAINS